MGFVLQEFQQVSGVDEALGGLAKFGEAGADTVVAVEERECRRKPFALPDFLRFNEFFAQGVELFLRVGVRLVDCAEERRPEILAKGGAGNGRGVARIDDGFEQALQALGFIGFEDGARGAHGSGNADFGELV